MTARLKVLSRRMDGGLVAIAITSLMTGCGSDNDKSVAASGSAGAAGATAMNAVSAEVLQQRKQWAEGLSEDALNTKSDQLVASAPAGTQKLTMSRISTTPRNRGGYGRGAAQIVIHSPTTHQAFVADSYAEKVPYFTIAADGTIGQPAGIIDYVQDMPMLIPRQYGVNSIAVSNGTLAIAVETRDETRLQMNGRVAFYDVSTPTPVFLTSVTVGQLPDMVGFSHDGSKLIVCDEGEPPFVDEGDAFTDYVNQDPEGSVAIIDRPAGGWAQVTDANVTLLGFQDFNDGGPRAAERPKQFRPIAPDGTSWSRQVEPEYAAISPDNKTAWVILQEHNAVAVVDLVDPAIKEIRALPVKDGLAAGSEFDASAVDGRVRLANWPVYMMYQPDSTESYVANDGKTYYVTANEGDQRGIDWWWSETTTVGSMPLDPVAFPGKDIWQRPEMLGNLMVTKTAGDANGDGLYENIYAFGGRSFSIWNEQGDLVFDSRNDIERITAKLYGIYFNNYYKEQMPDSMSEQKGAEPESLALGEIEGRKYAFIGLEKMCGVMVYDITEPANATFVTFHSTRHPELEPRYEDADSDLGQESIAFIPAAESPTGGPLLLVGNEVSGNISTWAIQVNP